MFNAEWEIVARARIGSGTLRRRCCFLDAWGGGGGPHGSAAELDGPAGRVPAAVWTEFSAAL